MVILIDSDDKELFMLMKAIADSGDGELEAEHDQLLDMVEKKGRKIRITYTDNDDVEISFPKKKRFYLF